MLWKIYLWFITLFTFYMYIPGIPNTKPPLRYWIVVDFLMSIGALFGFFLFSYKIKLLTANFWKIYLILFIIWEFGYNIFIEPAVKRKFFKLFNIVGIIFIVPVYFALFLYAFIFLS